MSDDPISAPGASAHVEILSRVVDGTIELGGGLEGAESTLECDSADDIG